MDEVLAEDLNEVLKIIAAELDPNDLRSLILGEELDESKIDALSTKAQEAYSFYVVTTDMY